MSIYEKLKEASGKEFQDLFSKLMKEKYGMAYQSTCTYGKIGDMSVDGILNFNIAFAVYAPEVYKDGEVIKKIKKDFKGFLSHRKNGEWKEIQKYVFVIKGNRHGITSRVIDMISSFNQIFPVDIMTMEDLEKIDVEYLPFTNDGRMLLDFKNDVTEIMEYIIDTDFAAEPFYLSLLDDIQIQILSKWSKKRNAFKDERIENLKNRILIQLNELCKYFDDLYVHQISEDRLLFNNDSWEAGERLRNIMQPQTNKIRCKVSKLLEELYAIK